MATKTALRTQIIVKYDCGFSSFLSIRGAGAKRSGKESSLQELSWNQGIPLKNICANEWLFECDASLNPCEFKILINDEIYEYGENHILNPHEKNIITPYF